MFNSVFKITKFCKTPLPVSIYSYSNNKREADFLKNLSKESHSGDNVAYVLYHEDKFCGPIGISCSSFDDIPALNINYLFVAQEYRKLEFVELKNDKVSRFLLGFAFNIAENIRDIAGLRWLTLTPDNDELEEYYKKEHKFLSHISKNKQTTLFVKI